MINPTSRGEPHHSLTVAARGRVGRTRAAVGHLPSENGQTHAQSNARTKERRKLNSLIYQRGSQSPAPTNTAGTMSHEPAEPPATFIVPLKRPTAHAYVGPPYDSATIKYLRFDCDTTKGALWRFGEAAHLLISQRSVKRRGDTNNSLRMRNNQCRRMASMCSSLDGIHPDI
jgi:hypothetical protein